MNETVGAITYSLAGSPYGAIIGGVAGFHLTRKFVSDSNWVTVPFTVFFALLGSGVEYRIRNRDMFKKMDDLNKELTTPKVEVKNAK